MSTTTRQRRPQQMQLGDSALATIPLYFEDEQGRLSPVGPLQSIRKVLEEQGEVSEQAIQVIARSYDNPDVVAHALKALDAIRVRKESGEVVFRLSEDGGAQTSSGQRAASEGAGKIVTQEGSASMAIGFASESALDGYERTGNLGVMMTWREAARLRRALRCGEDPQGRQWHADGRQERSGQGACQQPAIRWHRCREAHRRQAR